MTDGTHYSDCPSVLQQYVHSVVLLLYMCGAVNARTHHLFGEQVVLEVIINGGLSAIQQLSINGWDAIYF